MSAEFDANSGGGGGVQWCDTGAGSVHSTGSASNGRQWSQSGRPSTGRCYNCGKFGHKKSDCRQPDFHQSAYGYRGRGGGVAYKKAKEQYRRSYGSNKRALNKPSVVMTSEPVQQHFPGLEDFYLNRRLSDISLAVSGETLFAHKFVICVKSEVFKEMLFNSADSESRPSLTQPLPLLDTNVDAFKLLLKFLYTEVLPEEVTTDCPMAMEVLKVALRFKVQRLSDFIENKITEDSANVKPLAECLLEMIGRMGEYLLDDKTSADNLSNRLNESPVSQTALIDGLKVIVETNPKMKDNEFKKMIDLNKCCLEDIVILKNIGLFDAIEFADILKQK